MAEDFKVLPALFGPPPDDALCAEKGYPVVVSQPFMACSDPAKGGGKTYPGAEGAILLVQRGICPFTTKVQHVTQRNFSQTSR